MQLTDIAQKVMEVRYLRAKEDGSKETPQEMFRRVAHFIAQADVAWTRDEEELQRIEDAFYEMMDRQDFMPNSPTFTGAGTELGQLSACFVLPIDDCLSGGVDGSGIYDTLRDQALVHQTGGGTGFDFSRLRPNGASVRRSQGVASGPVSYMKVYNASTEFIKQGGTRRGANMGILRVDHPDILEFIHCKDDTTQVTNFNISVGITDEFMAALEEDQEYELKHGGKVYGTLRAKDVWDQMVECAWKTGEPGIVFIDRMNRRNPNNHVEVIEASNPCGEQPLPPYGSCNLGSINLGNFVLNPYTASARVNWHRLKETTHTATHFLDNVIDMNKYPIPKIREKALRDRRIGLGVMGWAEMLVMMGLPYDSDDAVKLGQQVRRFIKRESVNASQNLAWERGAYPEWSGSQWHKAGLLVRNSTMTTVAPTGTISLFAAKLTQPCSGGIEPKFAVIFTRNQAGMTMVDVDGQFREIAEQRGFWTPELIRYLEEHGEVQNCPFVPEDVKPLFKTANGEISSEAHVRMQAAWQGSDDESITDVTCSATSKTINFPNSATLEDVALAYEMAFDLDLKGITVYRDGSRFGQVLTAGKSVDEKKTKAITHDEPPAVVTEAPDEDMALADQMIAASCPIGGKCSG